MLRAGVSHLGSWSVAAAMQRHREPASTLGWVASGQLVPVCPTFLGGTGRAEQGSGLKLKLDQFERESSLTRKLHYGNNASDEAAILRWRWDLTKPPKLYPACCKVLGCPLVHVTQKTCPVDLMGLLQAFILNSEDLPR